MGLVNILRHLVSCISTFNTYPQSEINKSDDIGVDPNS